MPSDDENEVRPWCPEDVPYYVDLGQLEAAKSAWLNLHPADAPPWLTDADELPAQPAHDVSAAARMAHDERMAIIRARIKDTPSGAAQRADRGTAPLSSRAPPAA